MAIKRDCMRAHIRRELFRRIVDGVYQPGDRLIELQIAREFETSQAPVREALRELEALRVVETETYKGTRVRAISDEEHRESARVRGVIEEEAGRLAAPVLVGQTGVLQAHYEGIVATALRRDIEGYARHNTAFHRLILEAAGNRVMLRVWESLMLEAQTFIALRTLASLDLNAVAASHAPIVAALDAGDGPRAGRLLREHAESLSEGREPSATVDSA